MVRIFYLGTLILFCSGVFMLAQETTRLLLTH